MRKKLRKITTLCLLVSFVLGTQMTAFAAPTMMADGTVFDAEYYARSNPDVVVLFGTDAGALYNNYVFNGKAEGRQAYNPAVNASAMIDSAAQAAAINATLRPTDSDYLTLKNARPGNYVIFGAYEQDNNRANGQEPIEWLVLENNGDSLLVISKYVLDAERYSKAYDTYTYQAHPITWEQCSLRAWLNSTFYTTAFNQGEQMRIPTTLLDNSIANESFYAEGITGGNNTYDKVFILSRKEYEKYFPLDGVYYYPDGGLYNYNLGLCVWPTPYAVAQGVTVYSKRIAEKTTAALGRMREVAIGSAEFVATRTPDYSEQTWITTTSPFGAFGCRVATYDICARPAMRIQIK